MNHAVATESARSIPGAADGTDAAPTIAAETTMNFHGTIAAS